MCKIMEKMLDIKYGYVDKNNNIHPCIDKEFSKQYKLQSPAELIKSKCGICWDQVELERYYFKQVGMRVFTYFIVYYDNDKCPTHTFLAY